MPTVTKKKPTVKKTASAKRAAKRDEQLDRQHVELELASVESPTTEADNVDAAFAEKNQEAKAQVEKATAKEKPSAKLPPPAKDSLPRIIHDNKQHTSFFVQRDVRFEINPLNLSQTLGISEYDGEGAIDRLTEKQKKELCDINGWPYKNGLPWTSVVGAGSLRPLISGLVEITWRADVSGEEPRRCVENQERRVADYRESFARVAATIEKKKQERKARPSNLPVRTSAYATDQRKIKVLAKENPKRKGSAAYQRFELYRKSTTVADFIAKGGRTIDLAYDQAHDFIKVA